MIDRAVVARSRRTYLRRLGWLSIAIAGWILIVAIGIVAFSRQRSERRSDAAIVLGAAVTNGQPSPVFAARLDHAIDLYRRGIVRFLLLTGGVGEGDTESESSVGAAYAKARGIPADAILTESISKTTLQNLNEAARVCRESGIQTALIVSDPLHQCRALWMAKNVGIDAESSPTPTTRYQSWRSQLPFLLREIWFCHVYAIAGH